jgi:nicotinamidase/pyrazinamidase
VISKGIRFDKDQYSAFDDTGLAKRLRSDGVRRLWIGGLALDVCVEATAVDACEAGFEVRLIADATRPISPEGGERALASLRAAGVEIEERTE